MNLPHVTRVGWQVLTRTLDRPETVAADTAFDWDDLRHKLREAGVRPVIKHRELYSLEAAHNARIDDETYNRRSIVEAPFFALRQRFGAPIRARTWFGQFRAIVLTLAVRNIELALSHSTPRNRASKHAQWRRFLARGVFHRVGYTD